MQVHLVGMRASDAMREAGLPELTPEMLAAVGARYSRSGEGLDAILEKVTGMPQDQAVDNIFKMIDYGHQSIADMAPVAMFIDRISMFLVMKLWHWCPTASGQETSTRYVTMNPDDTVLSSGWAENLSKTLAKTVDKLFTAYQESLALWLDVVEKDPSQLNLPPHLQLESEENQKVRNRLIRNFAFDRSRYYLPLAAYTNVMMIMPARGWVELIQKLLGYPLAEAYALGHQLGKQLELVTPRLMKYAVERGPVIRIMQTDVQRTQAEVIKMRESSWLRWAEPKPFLSVFDPLDVDPWTITQAVMHHVDRYDGFGEQLDRIVVRYGWNALPIGEIRDLNRHRTGHKFFPLIPTGVYVANDEIAKLSSLSGELGGIQQLLSKLSDTASEAVEESIKVAMPDTPENAYWMPLGTQCRYEHVTTAGKFLYQCQLRTGTGVHFQYDRRMREVLSRWNERHPVTARYVQPGTGEPE